jgi:hypothetical protein
MTQPFDSTWDTEYQFGNKLPAAESRSDYEAACAMLGVPAMSDADIRAQEYGLTYAEYHNWRTMTREERMRWLLDSKRLRGMKAEAARVVPPPVAVARHAWGAHGTRYDEGCEGCGRTGDVDNATGLCRNCH